MKRWVWFLIQTTLFIASLAGWFSFGIEGCENLVRFYVAFVCFVAALGFMIIKPGMKMPERPGPVLRIAHRTVDVFVCLVFIWTGHMGLAITWLLTWAMFELGMAIARSEEKATTQTEPEMGGFGAQAAGSVSVVQRAQGVA